MKLAQANKLAIEAIDYQMQKLAPQANLYEMLKMPSGKTASEKRDKLREAKTILESAPGVELAETVYRFATQKDYWDGLEIEDLARTILGKKPRKKGKLE